jgi:hypothetical protein
VNEKTFRTLIEAGAVKKVSIVAQGARFHVEVGTPNGTLTAHTLRGDVKTWTSLDSAAKWVRGLGIGTVQVLLGGWQPGQRSLGL